MSSASHHFFASPEEHRAYLESKRIGVRSIKKESDGKVVFIVDKCPMNPDHGQRGDTAVIWRPGRPVGFKCFHNGCAEYRWADVVAKIDPAQSSESQSNSFPATIERELSRMESEWVPVPASQIAKSKKRISWVWNGFIAVGFITLMTGLWKAGKTTLLKHVIRMMDAGGDLAGKIHPATVLVVSEEPAQMWARRCRELGITEHVHFILRPFKTRPTDTLWEAFVQKLASLVTDERYGLVVIDTFSQVSPVTDENDSAKMIKALLPLHKVTEAGAGLLLTHHPRKGRSALIILAVVISPGRFIRRPCWSYPRNRLRCGHDAAENSELRNMSISYSAPSKRVQQIRFGKHSCRNSHRWSRMRDTDSL